MVLLREDTAGGVTGTGGWSGGGWNLFGDAAPTEEEDTSEEPITADDIEELWKKIKPLWPLVLVPLVELIKKNYKTGKVNELPWESIARITAPILAPIALSIAWILLTKIDKRIDWLSNIIAVAEVIPTVDLNLPQGVVLGSLYASADDVQKILTAIIEAGENLAGITADVVPDIPPGGDILTDIINLFRPSTWESVREFGK